MEDIIEMKTWLKALRKDKVYNSFTEDMFMNRED